MDKERVIQVLQKEFLCVKRQKDECCDKNCGECDLAFDAEETLTALKMATQWYDRAIPRDTVTLSNGMVACRHCGMTLLIKNANYCYHCGQRLSGKKQIWEGEE